MDSIWIEITRLGEAGFLLPVGALLLAWFLVQRCNQLAMLWAAVFGFGVFLVLASKIAFLSWGLGVRPLNFTGFSGHTMLASAVFPVLAWQASSAVSPRWRAVSLCSAVVLAGAVAASRVVLQAHSVSEVILGFVVGLTVSLGFIALGERRPEARIPAWLVALALVASSLVHVEHYAPSRGIIVAISLKLAGHQHIYRRDRWLAHPEESQT